MAQLLVEGGVAPDSHDLDKAEQGFSKLEASFATTEVARRPNSVEMKDVWRHNLSGDGRVNELEFDQNLFTACYPMRHSISLQDVFPAILYNQHLTTDLNFAGETSIGCFDSSHKDLKVRNLDSQELQQLTQDALGLSECPRNMGSSSESCHANAGRLIVLFVELQAMKDSSFASQASITQLDTSMLFERFDFNPNALLNLVGRPDYWAPQPRREINEDGDIMALDLFCQHPRWNLEYQGAPLSVYMKHFVKRNLTIYLLSHKKEDSIIAQVQNILAIPGHSKTNTFAGTMLSSNPFDLAVIISTLSLEASKHHFKKFQRFMWQQVNQVDDHLGGQSSKDRKRLGELTKSLQIVSQQADSHLLNCDVAIITATAIQDALDGTQPIIKIPPPSFQRASDAIGYMIQSMEKQKKLFLNFKNRKDGTMNLVYNLVTQQDAATNMQLAASMKKDSTSMNGIAALTMTFLPGTFTASVLSAGIFSAVASTRKISVSGLWWVWIVITIPLTALVLLTWYIYKRTKEKAEDKRNSDSADDGIEEDASPSALRRPSRGRTFSLATLSLFSSRADRGPVQDAS